VWSAWLDVLVLSMVTGENPPERQVLIQIRPVKPEWRDLDLVKLLGGALCQPRVLPDWEPDLRAAIHHHHNHTVPMDS